MNYRSNYWNLRKTNSSYQKCSSKFEIIFHMKMENFLEKYRWKLFIMLNSLNLNQHSAFRKHNNKCYGKLSNINLVIFRWIDSDFCCIPRKTSETKLENCFMFDNFLNFSFFHNCSN